MGSKYAYMDENGKSCTAQYIAEYMGFHPISVTRLTTKIGLGYLSLKCPKTLQRIHQAMSRNKRAVKVEETPEQLAVLSEFDKLGAKDEQIMRRYR